MRKNTSFSVGDHFAGFIKAQVGEGRYGSASEVVRAGLRLLEQQEARLVVLRAALIDGEKGGASARSVRDIWAAVKARSGAARAASPGVESQSDFRASSRVKHKS